MDANNSYQKKLYFIYTKKKFLSLNYIIEFNLLFII